ncbi:vacuolar protein 8 [Amborella trichopoda]|uniref:DUF7032 domain-containing protein n=1 Tax=Amborella trichopoda TaxID=13333 RepID=W1NI77_AMBTC|nr:vacuolar protein 8 [Amborella trichopoda]XP_020529219.1 vacuolar protein 8 [Amborella trichopoda]ERM95497.1 hypothetical protein AMTR_s00151p00031890 [Amborella trichopoda]|eukprot:XP_006828081.1 vacuolar protein 8 [Amborella trichopoda]
MQQPNTHLANAPCSELAPEECLDTIQNLISILILACLPLKVFVGRWQTIRTRLDHLQNLASQVSDCPHWHENALLADLLHKILSTLNQVSDYVKSCSEMAYSGKLLMQSDLDMVAAALSEHLRDLDVLLRSGVLRQSSAIVLSMPVAEAANQDVAFFVRDLFARLKIGGPDFKRKALDSLIELLADDCKRGTVVAKEGDVPYLIRLLDSDQACIREQAVSAVALLAENEAGRQSLFVEGGLGGLVRVLETCSHVAREKAASAIEALTSDPENAWALSAYGGLSALIELCSSGSLAAQTKAAGALLNAVNYVEDVRLSMAEEGESTVSLLVGLLVSGTPLARQHAAECLYILISSISTVNLREMIVRDGGGGVQALLQLLHEAPTPRAQEVALNAISALSAPPSPTARALVCCHGFLKQLSELLKGAGGVCVQHAAALTVVNLAAVSDDARSTLREAGCLTPLVKMLEAKAEETQEAATEALVALLATQGNRRDFVKDEKSLGKLVQLLDPGYQGVCKRFPLAVLTVLSKSKSSRRKIAAVGACQHLQRLVEMEVAGAKKVMVRITGGRIRNLLTGAWKNY